MRSIAFLAECLLSCAVWGVPTVSDLKVTPVAPWGLALDYTVSGATDAEVNLPVAVTATVDERTYVVRHLSGATNWTNGSHRVYWNMAKDGITATVTDCVVTVVLPLYCVIDLSGGTSATSYPVSYLSAVPADGWTDEYKTTKLVLRRIEAGSFIMGGGTTPESYRVTLTKPFYVGVFEVTQKQWELVMGDKPSYYKGDTRPVEEVSYNDIRGSSVGARWPLSSAVDATSFLGRLREKTGLEDFDLPTEAQWEYACRAGTTSKYNNGGDTKDDLKTLGRYDDNRSDERGGYTDAHTAVGSYMSNAWGLYDMHGNVLEWCLDWYDTLGYGVDPEGASSGSYRVLRGGSWYSGYDGARSSSRNNNGGPSFAYNNGGFRLSRTLTNKTECVVVGGGSAVAGSAAVSHVAWRAHGENDSVTGPLQIDYVPDGNGRAVVSIDGQTVVDSAIPGTYMWQPQANGTHIVTHSGWDEAFTAEYVVSVPSTVSNVVACQRWPWNSLVDIDYTITGGEEDTALVVRVTDSDTGRTHVPTNFLGGVTPPTVAGRHRITWDTAADGLDLISSNVTIEVLIVPSPYCVVDLSGGTSATSYPVSYLSAVPADGWTDEYKTTKLVLRRIEAGSFIMGGGTTPESYRVTLTKPFYVGVFEVTQKQWELVMGDKPSYYKGDTRPVEEVSYNDIRGSSVGARWPLSSAVDATSFLGRLREKTGLEDFDLPTEAQWEYTCRAGTTSKYNNGGDTKDDLKTLGRYDDNRSDERGGCTDAHTAVGSYMSNAWGLYDMHGNVLEWCLDWYDTLGYGVDPEGASSGSSRVQRGGSWGSDLSSARSSCRSSSYPSNRYGLCGFRLSRILENEKEISNRENGTVLPAGSSAKFTLDTRAGKGSILMDGATMLRHSSLWHGDVAATVTLAQDGEVFAENLTGEGAFVWRMPGRDTYTLTHTTYTNGVKGAVLTATFCTWKYTVNADGTATLTGASSAKGDVTIPDEIGGRRVSALGDSLFAGCAEMTGVTIPDGVTSLLDGLFEGCEALANVTLPDTLEDFGDNDLRAVGTRGGRNGLWVQDGWVLGYLGEAPTAIKIPDGVKGIAAYAFSDQSGLESVVFPDTLEYIGVNAFRRCTGLARIDLPDGVVHVDDGAFQDCTYAQTLAAPASLRRIGTAAFANAANLGKVAFADGLLEVGSAAFSNAWRMLSVSLPVSVTNVGADAFWNCKNLVGVTTPTHLAPLAELFPAVYDKWTSVVVAPGETRLVDGFFAGCASLAEVGLPVGISELGTGVFRDCTALVKVTLPEGLSELPDETFAGCTSLPLLVVPASVTRLGSRVFAGCRVLRSVQFLGNAPAADATFYEDAPAALVTYVADGTRGWDGLETSRNLPETWPAGAANAIATWTPTRLVVTFDAQGGEPVTTNLVETVGTTYRLPQPDPVRLGATFLGWWTETAAGAEVRPTTRVVLTGDHVLYAHWRPHGYTVAFDANGGVGTMASVARTVGVAIPLPMTAFRCPDHDFAGWALEPDGEAAFADGDDPGDLAYGDGETVTLYAVWRERAWTASDWLDAAGAAFSCAGDADWRPDETESHDGIGSMRSGVLGTALEGTVRSTLKASVRGQGVLSFWWKVVCEPADSESGDFYDYLELTVDGARPASVAPIAGETGWTRVEVRLTGAGMHEVAWSFVKDDYDDEKKVYADVAWVDEVSWTPDAVTLAFDGNGATGGATPDRISAFSGEEVVLPSSGTLVRDGCLFVGWSDGARTYAAGETYVVGGADVTFTAVWKELSVGEVLNATNLVFTTGGDANWVVDSAISQDGVAALRSGAVSAGQTCWAETSVTGAGTLAFWWKSDGLVYRGRSANYVEVTVDGTVAESVAVTNWTLVTVSVVGSGAHTVRWTYRQTRAQTAGGACAWLDAVTWTPALVPTVAGDAGATVTGDAEAGYVVTPSATNRNVEVAIPDGVSAATVTVEVGTGVETIRPNGATVRVMSHGYDITAFLDIPAAVSGVVNLASATVKEAIVKETLDSSKGAEIDLSSPSSPSLTTAPTRKGLVYTLREGTTLDAMKDGATTVGDGQPWTPILTVKGGASGFYTIRVDK